ncbi:MAG: hypothetical protein O9342_16120 [Beijerinckiaceae bacterium]|nr:hypothetical protein [Beijerinckiaceae bacterium]
MSLTNIQLLGVMVFSISLISSQSRAQDVSLCGRVASSTDHLEFQLLREEASLLGQTPLYRAYRDKPKETHWLFTVPLNPAHPAVACTVVGTSDQGQTTLKSGAQCWASKVECDKFADSIDEWHHQIARELGTSINEQGRKHSLPGTLHRE